MEADLTMEDTIALIKGLDISEYRRQRMLTFLINKPPNLPNYIALIIAFGTN